jgi:hypothetical protein
MILAITVSGFIFSGCSQNAAEMEQSLEDHTNEEKSEETEKEFIKSTIDASKEALSTLEELDYLLSDINFDYPSWVWDMMSIPNDFITPDNEFIQYDIKLTEEQKIKYQNTLLNYEKASGSLYKLKDPLTEAVDTYDKRKLQEIKGEIDPIKAAFVETLKQIEIERYE